MSRHPRLAGTAASIALVAVALALGAQGSGGGVAAEGGNASPHLVGVGALRALESSLGHFVYWSGSPGRDRLELTAEPGGDLYLRYLPPGAEVGHGRARFLTLGTYPVAGAQGALRRAARRAGSSLEHVAGGGLVLVNPSSRGSVYLAYPRSGLQIEVYDPTPGRSLRLIHSGAIRPVG